MLSPENFVILGQQTGLSQRLALLWLAVAAGIHFLTARTYDSDPLASSGQETQLPQTKRRPPAAALALASRGSFALWAITAVLVTAGYVFNETFVPAYPNLGFSFTCLAILLALNLLGTRVAALAQIIFVGTALAGWSVLIAVGLWDFSPTLFQSQVGGIPWKQSLALSPYFLVLFIGYELAGVLREETGEKTGRPAAPMSAGIIAAFCLFFLWSFLSLSYVPGLKLQESTVPYAYVARAIAGATGRQLMGVVLLAGTLATANALLMTVPRLVLRLPPPGLLSLIFRGRAITLLLLVGGIALAMALGLGGSPNLPIYLKAGALLWLLTYTRQHLAAWRRPEERLGHPQSPAINIACALLLAGAVALSLATDPEWFTLVVYMVLVVGMLALIGSIPFEKI